MWAGRLAWLGRWLYEPKVAGSSPARPTFLLFCNLGFCSLSVRFMLVVQKEKVDTQPLGLKSG